MANTTYTVTNLLDAEDLAPGFGKAEMGEARFAREALGAERIGLTYYKMNPDQRVGFGHRHEISEEVYLVLSGAGRFRIEDEIVAVGPMDAVFCPPTAMREWEAGPDGMMLVAFGGHGENESHMEAGWWPKEG